jgi:hypothetical protein
MAPPSPRHGKRKPGAIDKMMAETAEDHRAHAALMRLGKKAAIRAPIE